MSVPVSEHRPVMPDLADYGFLSVDVYLSPDQRGQADNGWFRHGRLGDNPDSGLKIQPYQNVTIPNHVVLVPRGTDFGFTLAFFKDVAALNFDGIYTC